MKKIEFYTYSQYSFRSCLLSVLTNITVVYLFLFSAMETLENISEDWTLSGGQRFLLIGIAALMVCVNEFFIAKMDKKQNAARWGMVGAVVALMAGFAILNSENLAIGFEELIMESADIYNLSDPRGGYIEELQMLFMLILLLLLVLGLIVSFLTRNIAGTIIIALAVQIYSLVINVAPNQGALLLAVMGILLCAAGGLSQQDISLQRDVISNRAGKKQMRYAVALRMAALVCALVVLGVTQLIFGEKAYELSESKEEVLAYQNMLVENVREGKGQTFQDILDFLFKQNMGGTGGPVKDEFDNRLTNEKPEYLNQALMTVHAKSKPASALYLRKGIEDTYMRGKWKTVNTSFSSLAEKQEQSMLESFRLSNQDTPVNLFRFDYSVDAVVETNYHPYFSDFSKESTGRDISSVFYGSMDEKILNWIMSASMIIPDRYTESDIRKYDTYVEDNCLDTEGLFGEIDTLIQEMTTTQEYRTASELVTETDVRDTNLYRYYMGLAVQKALSRYVYSLELDEVPDGEDVVSFFVNTSKKGYCMHFATAAVYALRSCGVPCRYAYGYIVPVSRFRTEADGYAAEVPDSLAHSWVEVYFKNLGWVPLEVTAGYVTRTSQSGGTQQPDDSQQQQPTQQPTQQQTQQSTEKDTQTETSTQTQATQTEMKDTTTEITDGPKPENVSSHFTIGQKAALVIALVLVVATGCVLAVLSRIRKDRRKLAREIKRRLNALAVRHMNRNMYKRLRMKGKILGSHLTDAEYEKVLCETFPQFTKEEWTRYMDIVKKATFSIEEISEEEMGLVSSMYSRKKNK